MQLRVAYTPAAEKYFKKLKSQDLKNAYLKAVISLREDSSIGREKRAIYEGSFLWTYTGRGLIKNLPTGFIWMMTAKSF